MLQDLLLQRMAAVNVRSGIDTTHIIVSRRTANHRTGTAQLWLETLWNLSAPTVMAHLKLVTPEDPVIS